VQTCDEPLVEEVTIRAAMSMRRDINYQEITIDVPNCVEISCAPDHVRRWQEALWKVSLHEKILDRFAAGHVRVLLEESVPLSAKVVALLADLSQEASRTFRNVTDMPVKISVVKASALDVSLFETTMRPLESVDIPVSTILSGEVLIQPLRRRQGRGVVGTRQKRDRAAGAWTSASKGLWGDDAVFEVTLKLKLPLEVQYIEKVLQGGQARQSFEELLTKAIRSASDAVDASVACDKVEMGYDKSLIIACSVTFTRTSPSHALLFTEGSSLSEDRLNECMREEGLLTQLQELTVLREARCTGVVDCSSPELPNVLVRIVSSEDDVCVSAPWTLVNLLPSAATCVLRSCSSDQKGAAADIDSFTVASGAQRPQFSSSLFGRFLSLSFDGYKSVQPVEVLPPGSSKEKTQSIILQDEHGTTVGARLRASDSGPHGEVVLKVYVDMVMIDRTGLSALVFGRCCPTASSSSAATRDDSHKTGVVKSPDGSSAEMIIQDAASHGAGDIKHRKYWRAVGSDRLLSFADKDQGASWNEIPVKHSIIDLPKGGWEPCVQVRRGAVASSEWLLLPKRQDPSAYPPDDGEDGDNYAYEIEMPGTLDLVRDGGADHEGEPDEQHCVFHLGVQVRQGEFPFQKTWYVSIVPRYTVVNESGFTLQVCQEGSPSILAEVCILV